MLHLYLEVDSSAAFLQRLQHEKTTRDQNQEEPFPKQAEEQTHHKRDDTCSDELEDAISSIASSSGTSPSSSASAHTPTSSAASTTIKATENTHPTQPDNIPSAPNTTGECGLFNASQKLDIALLARDIGEWDASEGFPWESVIRCVESSMVHFGSSLHARAIPEGAVIEESGFLV